LTPLSSIFELEDPFSVRGLCRAGQGGLDAVYSVISFAPAEQIGQGGHIETKQVAAGRLDLRSFNYNHFARFFTLIQSRRRGVETGQSCLIIRHISALI